MYSPRKPVYYAGFDPGSGDATLAVATSYGDVDIKTIPSVISEGDIVKLLTRGKEDDPHLSQVIEDDEYVLNFNDTNYYLGKLVREGIKGRATAALGDQNRYWSEHSVVLLLTLAATLIPDQSFELRLVTALPVTLYSNENRKRVKSSLENRYQFTFNGMPREAVIKVGHVATEGQGILIHCGDSNDEQVVIDIGERTIDLIVADGQKILINKCVGIELGVGQIVDDLVAFGVKRKVGLERKSHSLLRSYVKSRTCPTTYGIDGSEIESTIADSIRRAGRSLRNFISQNLASDGEVVAAQYDRVFLAGGGAYYFEEIVRKIIDTNKVEVVSRPEIANALGYADIAASLQRRKATIWEVTYAA